MLKRTIVILAALLSLAAFTAAAVPAQEFEKANDWQFYANLYGWMPNIYGKSATDTKIEIDLDDILDNLEFTVMSTVGVKKDKWEFAVDVVYLDLEDKKKQTENPLGIDPVNLHADLKLQSWILTPHVAYNIIENEKFKLNLLAGARYLYLDVDLKVKIDGLRDHERSGSDSGSVWDAIVGLKGEVTLNKKWFMSYYADIGTGESDLTFNLFGGLGYRFNKVDLIAGWRYLRWNFDDNKALDNLYISGPIAGISYRF